MQQVPLTIEQQNALKGIAWVTAAVSGAVSIGLGTILACIAIAGGTLLVVRIFVIICLLIMLPSLGLIAWRVYTVALDVRKGMACVHEAHLSRKFTSRRSTHQYYAVFDTPGTLLLAHDVWEPLEPGRRYLVTYSPRSRIGWLVEPHPGDTALA